MSSISAGKQTTSGRKSRRTGRAAAAVAGLGMALVGTAALAGPAGANQDPGATDTTGPVANPVESPWAWETGRRLHREQVFDALWPEVDPEKAVGMLYRSATAARKVLGSTGSILLAGEAVALLPDDEVEIDVDLLTETDQSDPGQVDTAIAAYGGELLPGALYAEWTVNRRAQLKQTYLDLLARAGRWRTIIEVDPAHEDAHIALMREALDQGDRHGVLRRYELLEQALLDELGTEPGQTAKELRDAAEVAEPAAGGSVVGLRALLLPDGMT